MIIAAEGGSAAPQNQYQKKLRAQVGYNAIRSAHNPLSPAFIDACDRLGMLVIDEAFDRTESR